jgi:hypothetical protein
VAHANVALAGLYAVWASHRIALAAARASGHDAVLVGEDEARLVNAMDAAAATAQSLARLYGELAAAESRKTGEHPEYRRSGRVLAASWPETRPLAFPAPQMIPLGGLCSAAHGGGASEDLCRLDLLSPPVVLRPDWALHRFSRGYALLTATDQSERRGMVGIARGKRPMPGAPVADRLLATAQAETWSTGGHDDLWHADWASRMVPYQPIGAAAGGGGEVLSAVREIETSAAHGELAGRWVRH